MRERQTVWNGTDWKEKNQKQVYAFTKKQFNRWKMKRRKNAGGSLHYTSAFL